MVECGSHVRHLDTKVLRVAERRLEALEPELLVVLHRLEDAVERGVGGAHVGERPAPGEVVEHARHRHGRLLRARVVAELAGQAVVDEPREDRAQVAVVELAHAQLRDDRVQALAQAPRRLERVAALARHRPVQLQHEVVEGRRVGRVGAPHDLAQHQEVRVVEPDGARPRPHARLPARVGHRVVAGVAVEHDQFREEAVAAALRVEDDVEAFLGRERLPDGPHAHAVPAPLALAPVLVDDEVRRLGLGEGVELEAQARVAGAHDAVGDELVLVAEVARQAQARERHGILGRIEAVPHVLLVRGARRDVRLDPVLASARGRPRSSTPSDALKRSPRRSAGGLWPWQSTQIFASCAGCFEAEVRRDALAAVVPAAPGSRAARACPRATR